MSAEPKSEDRKPDAETRVQSPAASEASATSAAAQSDSQQPPSPSPTIEEQVAEARSQVADLTDRLLRAHAEMDNMRKRAEREKIDISKFAISKFAGEIVTVGDNFKRAVAAVPAGAVEQDEALKVLLDGVLMIEREFLNVLERNGVRRVDPNGEIFNPHLHQAVMEKQNLEVPSGTIVQVFEAGYSIDDRVLRPAMVAVAKGGPKPQANGNGNKTQASASGDAEKPQEGTGTGGTADKSGGAS
jgi:molecular chaperone GrpE